MYAKKLDRVYYQDLFNDAWIKFRLKEIEGLKDEKGYKNYFRVILKNTFLDSVKKSKPIIIETNIIESTFTSTITQYDQIESFFDTTGLSENETCLRNILEISSKTGSVTEASRLTGIKPHHYAKLLSKAKLKFEESCIF